jgi:hypothetical protein
MKFDGRNGKDFAARNGNFAKNRRNEKNAAARPRRIGKRSGNHRAKLREKGLTVSIVSDEKLAADVLPTRLRGLEFDGERLLLILFNTSEIVEIQREDLILIVSGAIYERKTESVEKRKKGENKILDASETTSDESLIDIYSREYTNGYRILAKGFDFSSLEAEKGMIATENMKKLAAKLWEFAPNAKFDNDYSNDQRNFRRCLGNRKPQRFARFEATWFRQIRFFKRGDEQQFAAVYQIFAASAGKFMNGKGKKEKGNFEARDERRKNGEKSRRSRRGEKTKNFRDENSRFRNENSRFEKRKLSTLNSQLSTRLSAFCPFSNLCAPTLVASKKSTSPKAREKNACRKFSIWRVKTAF